MMLKERILKELIYGLDINTKAKIKVYQKGLALNTNTIYVLFARPKTL